jgi:hypothetical protein
MKMNIISGKPKFMLPSYPRYWVNGNLRAAGEGVRAPEGDSQTSKLLIRIGKGLGTGRTSPAAKLWMTMIRIPEQHLSI